MGIGSENDDDSTQHRDTTNEPLLPVPVEPDQSTHRDRDPIEPRPYIEIRPSETRVDPGTVVQAMDLLASLLHDLTNTGLLTSLRGNKENPLVEWLLVSDGREDPQLRYLVGTPHSDMTEDLLGILRTCFPNTYELREITWHPRYVEEHLPVATPDSGDHSVTLPNGEVMDTTVYPYVAGVEYRGHAELRRDWQTALASFGTQGENADRQRDRARQHDQSYRVPIVPLVETMRDANVPVVYQVTCRRHPNWSDQADMCIQGLEEGTVGLGATLWELFSPRSAEEREAYTPSHSDQQRIESIADRDPTRSVCVSARAAVLTRTDNKRADTVARRLKNVFSTLSGPYHEIRGHVSTDAEAYAVGTVPPGSTIYEDLLDRVSYHATYDDPRNHLPWRSHQSKGIVVAPDELAGFCLVDGAGLTPNGRRALGTRNTEQTAITLPPPQTLVEYTPPGMALCMPLTHDRRPYGEPLYLKPSQQDRHIVVVGDTGSGKSVLMETAMLTNADATEGPEILFDYKGGGTAMEYLRSHYAMYGSLDDVVYFDLSEVLPAFSFFDIRPLLDAGIPREEARSRKAGHYEEILKGLMSDEKYGEAAESVKAIRNHLRALYDADHGSDAVDHTELYEALRRTQRRDGTPETTDENLQAYFESLEDRDRDVFNKVLSGALGRVETIATDGRLAPVFDHAPADRGTDAEADAQLSDEETATPSFEFSEIIDDDVVVVFDFGGMEATVKRTLTLVILSELWTALKAREQRVEHDASETLPQVNLYLEEARDIGATKLVDTLLSEGRSFGLSVALGVQFLEQLDSPDPENNTYQEALNETATFVVGNVSVDTDLPGVLATEKMPPEAVDKRLSAMSRGEWLVRPGTEFGERAVRPFLARSLRPPTGHPAGEEPLTGKEERRFLNELEQVQETTAESAGLVQHGDDSVGQTASAEGEATTDAQRLEQLEPGHPDLRTDTLLPHTTRIPECVTFDAEREALCCTRCENRYDPTIDGMERAIECCHSPLDVDRGDIPVCEVNLKLSPEEVVAADWTLDQLLFLQSVYNAQQRRYDPREYRLRTDSMLRLQEYVGIESDEIQALEDAGLLRHDTDHPHRMYSVSAAGRDAIGESYREGVDFGHREGDLRESTQHVYGVELGVDLLEQQYEADPDSPVETVQPYHEVTEGELPASAFMGDETETVPTDAGYERHRLDVAGLDGDGNVVVAIEVERVNNDLKTAAPDDFDKIAACDPDEAIWIVMTRSAGHEVLAALNDPAEGDPRIKKTYSQNTPPQQFRIDTAGMTALYPASYLESEFLDATSEREL